MTARRWLCLGLVGFASLSPGPIRCQTAAQEDPAEFRTLEERFLRTPKGTLGKLPEKKYTKVFQGARPLDVSDSVSQECKNVWEILRPALGQKTDFTYHTGDACKVFRFPMVVRIDEDMSIASVPCRAGLIGFHQNGQLGYCILADSIEDPQLEAGEPIGFDESGWFNYPSESKHATITISATPGQCTNVAYTPSGRVKSIPIGSTTTSANLHVQAYRWDCTCSSGKQGHLYTRCTSDCERKFHCD